MFLEYFFAGPITQASVTLDDLAAQFEALYQRTGYHPPLIPHAEQALRAVRASGIISCLVTNRTAAHLTPDVPCATLTELFDVVQTYFSCYETENATPAASKKLFAVFPKPDPRALWPVLHYLDTHYGVPLQHITLIGDSLGDAGAAAEFVREYNMHFGGVCTGSINSARTWQKELRTLRMPLRNCRVLRSLGELKPEMIYKNP